MLRMFRRCFRIRARFCFLDEHEVAVVARDGIRLMDAAGNKREPQFQHITWDPIMAEKGGYKHFMLKEIYEQPRRSGTRFSGDFRLIPTRCISKMSRFTEESWKSFKHIRILACGTSWHAALAGKYMIESLARIPVEVDYASEYRYRNPVILPDTLFIFITQSGETLDTIAAQRHDSRVWRKSLTITNVVGSMTTRVADAVLYTRAGPEIGVASTKAFTTQLDVPVSGRSASRQNCTARVRKPRFAVALTDLTELAAEDGTHSRKREDISKISRKVCSGSATFCSWRGASIFRSPWKEP